ncbi:hypothetical protein NMG60_11037059 [Bertholletia excelsa]
MASPAIWLGLFPVLLAGLIGRLQAINNFTIGDKDGWAPYNYPDKKARTNAMLWAGELRFQINDTLNFSGSGPVLVVSSTDYYDCTTRSPNRTLRAPNLTFTFDRPGPFYFISADHDNCTNGQKMILVVITPRSKAPAAAPSPDCCCSPDDSPILDSVAADIFSTSSGTAATSPAVYTWAVHLLFSVCLCVFQV